MQNNLSSQSKELVEQYLSLGVWVVSRTTDLGEIYFRISVIVLLSSGCRSEVMGDKSC